MSMLKMLELERVVSFELNSDGTILDADECCDGAFGMSMKKNQVAQLIGELQALYDRMHD